MASVISSVVRLADDRSLTTEEMTDGVVDSLDEKVTVALYLEIVALHLFDGHAELRPEIPQHDMQVAVLLCHALRLFLGQLHHAPFFVQAVAPRFELLAVEVVVKVVKHGLKREVVY